MLFAAATAAAAALANPTQAPVPPATAQVAPAKTTFEPPRCYDFLKSTQFARSYIKFVDCKVIPPPQMTVYKATYEIAGRDAAAAEAHLVAATGMAPLVFACCGWETPYDRYGEIPSPHLMPFQARLSSGETVINDRKRWSEIDKFTLTVELLSEFP